MLKTAIRLMLASMVALTAMVSVAAFGVEGSANNVITIPVRQVFNSDAAASSEAPPALGAGVFSYVFTAQNPANPMPAGTVAGSYTFTIQGNGTYNIGPITFTSTGSFYYEIRSNSPERPGYTLDDVVYLIRVTVRDEAGGGLIATFAIVGSDTGLKYDEALFEKEYTSTASYPVVTTDIPVVKTVQGHPATPYTFTFRLTALTPNAPMPTGATGNTFDITIRGSGREYFGTWTYTTPGVFVYEVREIDTGNSDYDFDDTVYRITDTVTDENGQLVVSRVIVNSETNAQVSSLSFINTFTGGPGPDNDDEDVPVAENDTGNDRRPPGGTTTPTPGPKTGDYADPAVMIMAMAISAAIALFALFLIYFDRRSEKEYANF